MQAAIRLAMTDRDQNLKQEDVLAKSITSLEIYNAR